MENRIGFGPRLGAYLIDIVLVTIVGWIFSIVFAGLFAGLGAAAGGGMGGGEGAAVGGIMGMVAGILTGFFLASILYNLLEAIKGYTLGKLMLGLQIGNEDGTKAPIGTLFLRYAIKNIGMILSFLALIPFLIWIGTFSWLASLVVFIGCFFAIGAKKQALHDMIGKTAVFKRTELQ